MLAGLEPGRAQVQILHDHDPCCFRAEGRHPSIRAYNSWVQSVLAATDAGGGVMRTAVTAGNFHEVNFRDKVIVASVVEAFRAQGGRTVPDNVKQLPFDIL